MIRAGAVVVLLLCGLAASAEHIRWHGSSASVYAPNGDYMEYNPANVTDGDQATAWAAEEGPATGASVRVETDEPVTIDRLLVRPGRFLEGEWDRQNRIRAARIEFAGGSIRVYFEDSMVDHVVVLSPPVRTDWVRLTIEETSKGTDRWSTTYLSDFLPIEWEQSAALVPPGAVAVYPRAEPPRDMSPPGWLSEGGAYLMVDRGPFLTLLLGAPKGEGYTGEAVFDDPEAGERGTWYFSPGTGFVDVVIAAGRDQPLLSYTFNQERRLVSVQEVSTPMRRLIAAIKSGDLARVRTAVGSVADLNAAEPNLARPLHYALEGNYAEIAEYLIDRGASPLAGGVLDSSLPETVSPATLDLLRKAGAAAALAEEASLALHRAVLRGDSAAAARISDRYGVVLPVTLAVMLLYHSGSDEIRRMIHRYLPGDMENGKANLVDSLLARQGIGLSHPGDLGNLFDYLKFPLASSFLWDDRNVARYAPASAVDGDPGTSWVEGVDGPGIGQKIAFRVPQNIRSISILPGYGDPRYFSRNNRVRAATLDFYLLTGGTSAATTVASEWLAVDVPLGSQRLHFSDEMRLQGFSVSLPAGATSDSGIIGVLTIDDVYPGSEWDDTCIAEIQVVGR